MKFGLLRPFLAFSWTLNNFRNFNFLNFQLSSLELVDRHNAVGENWRRKYIKPSNVISQANVNTNIGTTVTRCTRTEWIASQWAWQNFEQNFEKIGKISDKTIDEFQKDQEKCDRLKARKAELEMRLRQKMQELKDVCVEEGDITGEMPVEINDVVLPGDDFPRLKRRVGTAYSIPDELIKADKVINFLFIFIQNSCKISKSCWKCRVKWARSCHVITSGILQIGSSETDDDQEIDHNDDDTDDMSHWCIRTGSRSIEHKIVDH